MDSYAVVRFLDEIDTIELVPSKWMKDPCTVYWPPYDNEEDCDRALRKEENVEKNTWLQCKVKVLSAAGRTFKKY